MARDEATKSKLVKLLQQVSRGSSARIGLVLSREAHVPAMALVVGLEQVDAQLLAAAVVAGADAVAVPAAQAAPRWPELAQAAGDKPLGLLVTGEAAISADDLKTYVDQGADFLVAVAAAAPAALLTTTGIGKIVALDQSYPAQLIRALGEMAVDAVLAEAGAEGAAGPLTVRDLLHYRQVVDLVRRPVLVAADQRLTPEALPPLRDMGVEGLLLSVPAAAKPAEVREHVAAYRKAIDGLGRPIGRGREYGREAVLPRVTPSLAASAEPEEEPDEE